MKFGVFGDSFAANKGEHSWTNYLIELYNCGFHARGGTGLDWAYYQFKQHHENYDRIILFVSNLCRETVFAGNTIDVKPVHLFGTYENDNYTSNTFFLNRIPRDVQKYIDAKKQLWENYPYNNYIAYAAMVDAVQAIRPDSIVVYSYPQMNSSGLYNVSLIDIDKFNTENETPKRCNHMSPQQNLEFWRYLNNQINDPRFDLNSTMTLENVDRYYTASDTLEQSGLKE